MSRSGFDGTISWSPDLPPPKQQREIQETSLRREKEPNQALGSWSEFGTSLPQTFVGLT